jgi:hypothetical protein
MKDKIKEYFRKNSLKIFLTAVIILFFVYIFSNDFRCYLLCNNIDPNFIVGFLTAIALVLSIIQNISDRRFSYNTNLVNSVEDKGIKIIAKLLVIRQKSEILSGTIEHIKNAMDNNKIYLDSNNALSKEDIEKELEMATAYIQTYFPEERENWNSLQDKLSKLSTDCSNVLLNYQKNIELLKDSNFYNDILSNIDNIIDESKKNYNEIDKLAMEMYERLVEKMNKYKNKLKDNFYFKL